MASPSRSDGSLRVVVAGYLVRGPLGGSAWQYLQYALGFDRLGHDVYFIEDSDDVPWSCYDPVRGVSDEDPSYGLSFATEAFSRSGFGTKWAYYDAHTDRWLGPFSDRIIEICRTADLLVNISGSNPLRPWLLEIPHRVYIDTDPAFTQIRHLTDPARQVRAAGHTTFMTFGENVGRSDCLVPDDGFDWQATRQPVVLDAWPVLPGKPDARFTTIMQWDSYPEQEYEGLRYGLKSKSFEPYVDLPDRVGCIFELAVGGSAPVEELRGNGWEVSDPLSSASDPWTYQDYIQHSKGEFTVAKHGYVRSWSGWFSERSTSYLASGRPVVVQDSGFSTWLPTGTGVLGFSDPDEAVAALENVNQRYVEHCTTARELADAYFDSDYVLAALIDRIDASR